MEPHIVEQFASLSLFDSNFQPIIRHDRGMFMQTPLQMQQPMLGFLNSQPMDNQGNMFQEQHQPRPMGYLIVYICIIIALLPIEMH